MPVSSSFKNFISLVSLLDESCAIEINADFPIISFSGYFD